MKPKITGKPKIVLLFVLILYALIFLLSCFSSQIHPSRFPYITYLSLGFPVLFVGYVCIAIPAVYYFFRKQLSIAFLILLPSFNNVAAVFSFHLPHSFQTIKQKDQIRILSWNVNAFLYKPYEVLDVKERAKQAAMVDFIKEMQADILCFQDFAEAPEMYGKVNVSYIADSLHYPYHYFSEDGANYGTIIFSRLPVIDSGRTQYTERKYPESIAYVDVLSGKDTLRVFNTHLRSMNLHQETITPENIGYLEFVKEDTAVLFHVSRFQRLEYFDRIHARQAEVVKNKLDDTKLPFVLCADLNAVPSSYVYHHIQNGLTDAFLAKGSGLSGTYHKFTPALRIDVLLMGNSIKPVQFYSPKPDLSDHYPLVTDIQLHN